MKTGVLKYIKKPTKPLSGVPWAQYLMKDWTYLTSERKSECGKGLKT